jgi:predicted AlkP superfamily phosphohydrolase/phosphomutase
VDRAIEEVHDLIDSRFEAAKHLLEEYNVEFTQITTFYINMLQHFFWNDECTLEAWKIIDDHVGDLYDSETNLVLMSDHGSTSVDTVFHINTWLEEQGYLTLDDKAANLLYNLGVNQERLIELATKFGIREFAEGITPEFLLRKIPDEQGTLNRENKTDIIDWENTTALASGQGPVYLALEPENPRYNAVRREVKDKLESLTDPSGRPIAKNVRYGTDIYSGEFTPEGPDLCINQTDGIHIAGGVGRNKIFSNPTDEGWKGENKRHGLFAATGPDFGVGEINYLSILDIAPTILHLYNMAIPSDIDGEVRQDIFADESQPRLRPTRHTRSNRKQEEIRRFRNIAQNELEF